MDSRPQSAEPISLFRALRMPLLSFLLIFVALLAIPDSVAALTSGAPYVPLVSLFVAGIKVNTLPAGWVVINETLNEPLEIYVAASATLALLLSSPVTSYFVMKHIAPALATQRRTLYSLVVASSALLAVGVMLGIFFLIQYYIATLSPFYVGVGALARPNVDAANTYFLVLRLIGSSAVTFTLPVYVFALIRFRRT
jgi:Sec-independent protein secretion pathway component TatC